MQRAEVLEWDLQRQLIPYMKKIQPLPSIYIPDFIAANQADRANNVIDAKTKKEMVEHIRNDIKVIIPKITRTLLLTLQDKIFLQWHVSFLKSAR